MFNAEGVDVTLFDFVAADDRHPQLFPKFLGKSGFSRSRSARDDDAIRFSIHISEFANC